MGNQNQDEVFLAAQEAVGAHRDNQGRIFDPFCKTFSALCNKYDFSERNYDSLALVDCHLL